MQKAIESIFSNILLVCAELDLLGGTHFSLDGVKLQDKLKQVVAEHIRADELERPRV